MAGGASFILRPDPKLMKVSRKTKVLPRLGIELGTPGPKPSALPH